MNEKQQQLTFDKGITNVPSDALCSDNALEESVGMIYDNGEHRVIQKPEVLIDTAVYTSIVASGIPTILYIHKFNNEERYIGYITGGTIVWGTKSDTTFTQIGTFGSLTYTQGTQITSIGKTLIITDSAGLHYRLWKGSVYEDLGDKIPDPEIDFWLYGNADPGITPAGGGGYYFTGGGQCVVNTVNYDGILNPEGPTIEDQEAWNNFIVGAYAKNVKSIAEKGGFCKPFFVRYAIEMYDGTYTHISQPILMFPSVRRNTWNSYYVYPKQIQFFTKYCYLNFNQKTDLSDWSDIIKSICIFVSRGVDLYDTIVDQPVITRNTQSDSLLFDGVFSGFDIQHPNEHFSEYKKAESEIGYRTLKQKEEGDLKKEIEAEFLFYNICSLGLRESSGSVQSFMLPHTLENLTTLTQLPEDDYFSRSDLSPKYIYSYNSRLNMANVKRSMFEGFDFFIAWDDSSSSNYDIYVTIETDSGNFVVKHTSEPISTKQGVWFYYPDSRAKEVAIKNGQTMVLNTKLTQHPNLNGAYYFAGLPDDSGPTPDTGGSASTTETTDNNEILPNYIIQSEVNNPFIFKAAGYFKVGTGKIVGMSTITQALSEGQFGQFPLLVFSESGIWSLSVASTGYYDSVRPMSREVALLDNPCITQTDGAVYFASKKGLMVVVGNQVKCVSEQLSGKDGTFNGVTDLGNFAGFLETAIIAYDYRDSLLWIFDKTHTTCYIYSIKSGTFGRYEFGTGNAITNVVNYYPDYLIQNSSGIYSLLERENINSDTDAYSGTIITRPMKLESALALKSIMQVRHITDMEGSIALKIYASNNLNNWEQLRSLRGMPWKYYRFRYDFTNMAATDRFAGTMLITQERRTDKLR